MGDMKIYFTREKKINIFQGFNPEKHFSVYIIFKITSQVYNGDVHLPNNGKIV